ncbi:TerD family protein [Micrococcales bacterium 31B]|nr:TerD family protein [Micrococcales bacterium 31B]
MSINLQKNSTINLAKSDGSALSAVRMGLGWDAVKKKGFLAALTGGGGDIDLDASAILMRNTGEAEVIYFGNLNSRDGSIRHTGDNLTGAGDGDDESILVDLTRVEASVTHMYFVVSSFRGQNFSQVQNAFVRVLDCSGRETEIARFMLTEQGDHTGLIMAGLKRTPSGWTFTAIGQPAFARVPMEMVPSLPAL